jgi:hypothetical protein
MATKPQSIWTETAHFNNFRKFLPAFEGMCEETVDHLLKMGVLQVSTAFEHALANLGNCEVINANHCDLSNDGEAKLTTTQLHRGKVDAHVHNVIGKTGQLLVQIYEQFTDKIYYFSIPYSAYAGLKVLEIPFTNDGLPKRNTKWYRYEVDSFETLATSLDKRKKKKTDSHMDQLFVFG